MSRASRLLELMELLRQRRTPIPAADLAEKLDVSVRTLYRDIATLQEQGADIQGEAGIGYVLRPGFTLPPLMFTADEIEALVLGSRWVEVRGDGRLSAAASAALSKVRGVLPVGLRESIDEAILTVPDMAQRGTAQRGSAQVTTPGLTALVDAVSMDTVSVDAAVLREAIRAERKLTIAYCDNAGQASERVVWPFLIGYFERVQVLAAWCELREDFRGFRVDRIARAEDTGQHYPRKRTTLVREWRKARELDATDRN